MTTRSSHSAFKIGVLSFIVRCFKLKGSGSHLQSQNVRLDKNRSM